MGSSYLRSVCCEYPLVDGSPLSPPAHTHTHTCRHPIHTDAHMHTPPLYAHIHTYAVQQHYPYNCGERAHYWFMWNACLVLTREGRSEEHTNAVDERRG